MKLGEVLSFLAKKAKKGEVNAVDMEFLKLVSHRMSKKIAISSKELNRVGLLYRDFTGIWPFRASLDDEAKKISRALYILGVLEEQKKDTITLETNEKEFLDRMYIKLTNNTPSIRSSEFNFLWYITKKYSIKLDFGDS